MSSKSNGSNFLCSVEFLASFLTFLCGPSPAAAQRNDGLWFHARNFHTGLGLSDVKLIELASLTDTNHFQTVLGPILVERVVGTPAHDQVRQHIVSSMQDLGWSVTEEKFDDTTPLGSKSFTNIIATHNPAATRRLVLACHYDSKYTPGEVFIGATDSAVPCAMMINLAHTLQAGLAEQRNQKSDLTLQLLFLDGEEAFQSWTSTDSIYGARSLANKLVSTPYPQSNNEKTTELSRMDLFILLDLLGTSDVKFLNYFPASERWYYRMASFERRLAELQLLHQRNIMFQPNKLFNAGIEDDHIPFLKKGVPILHLIPIPFPSVWHKRTDDATALDLPTINNLNLIVRAFVVDYLHMVS